MGAASLHLTPLQGLPAVAADDALGDLIIACTRSQAVTVDETSVLIVAQKVVSKSEGRLVCLDDVQESTEALALAAETGKDPRLVELILQESIAIIRVRPGLIIAEHRSGHILANAGIDTSNVGVSPNHDAQHVLLWPEDPDASAKALSRCMFEAFGVSVPVIINDSLGRPWRMGTVGFAIGVAGLQPVWDQVGERDLDGRVMQVTAPAVADALAAAASLVQGETDQGMPVVWAQGVALRRAADGSSRDLLRQREQDMFR